MRKKKKFVKTTHLPSHAQQLIAQARSDFLKGDYDHAIKLWETVRQHHPLPAERQTQVVRALAEAYFRRGLRLSLQQNNNGLNDLQRATELQPTDALFACHCGLACHRQRNYLDALNWYREAQRRDPAFRRADYPMALALVQSGQRAEQHPVWQRLNEAQQSLLRGGGPNKAGSVANGVLTQGLAAAAEGRWAEATPLLQAALTEPNAAQANGLAHYYLGVAAQHGGDTALAVEHWRQAFDSGLNMPHLHENLALACLIQADKALPEQQFDQALRLAQLGLQADAQNKRLKEIESQAQMEIGYAAARQGQWQPAVKAWSAIENPSGPNARDLAANLALAYEKLEQWPQAAEAWSEFVRRRPRKAGAESALTDEQIARLWGRMSVLYLRADLPEKAVSTLQTALKYQPDDPTLMLALARCYVDEGRIDAAHNQVDRVLKAAPKNIEALILKAELSEQAPRGTDRYWSIPGVREWKQVLAANDPSYVTLAKERLKSAYEEQFDNYLQFGMFDLANEVAVEALETLPDYHFLRSRYVRSLLQPGVSSKPNKKNFAKVHEQIKLIDLSDWDALHQLIDAWHVVQSHDEAAALIQQANAIKPLDSDFFLGVAGCALDRKQNKIAQGYFDEALKRASDEPMRRTVRAEIGLSYASSGDEAKAESIWKDILKEAPGHGKTEYYLAFLAYQRGESKQRVKQHLFTAEKWAKAHADAELLQLINALRQTMDSPIGMLSGLLGPGAPPGIQGMLNNLLGGLGEDEVEELLDLDLDDGGFDLPPEIFDFPPEPGRRRKSKKRGR